MDRWYLLTDRTLKGYQLYGPFPTSQAADDIARELQARRRIKSWSVVIAQIPPRMEDDQLISTAEL